MSHSPLHPHHVVHAWKHVGEHGGANGAMAGAVAVAGTVALTAAVAGAALTPIGWGVCLAAGAAGGGSGLFKKIRDKIK